MRKWLTLVFLFIIMLSINGCSKLPIDTNMSEDVADFAFTTQDNEPLSLDDLSGKWWIADFIFTNCTTVCLPMTSNMAQLQKELENKDIHIQFVSFSVDPDYDKPKVLKEYGEHYDANFTTWSFLTGYEFQEIKELSIKSFRAPLKEPEYGSDQVMHDTRFFLVNPEGKVVKGYDGVESASMKEIIDDLTVLKKEEFL